MKKFMLMSVFAVSLFLVSCESDILDEASQANNTENDDISTRSSRSNRDGAECPPSYVTVIPCDDKFNFQLHWSPGGTGAISPWTHTYTLTTVNGTLIQSGNISHGTSTISSSMVMSCQTYILNFTGGPCAIYPATMTVTSDGCGNNWNC